MSEIRGSEASLERGTVVTGRKPPKNNVSQKIGAQAQCLCKTACAGTLWEQKSWFGVELSHQNEAVPMLPFYWP